MSERKVLNKYYPPDFDPNKIPKLKVKRTGVFNIRVMAPCNMRCNNCGEYIYKGKKFNSRKENVDDEFYLGLRIFRFYIKCPRCVSEIAFKTDLKNTDYTLEAGATRNFEAAKTAEAMARQEIQDKEDEERNNPMKVLENRTLASQREMEQIELLEELQDINMTKANVDHGQLLEQQKEFLEKQLLREEQEMEDEVRSIFARTNANESVKRLRDSDSDDGDDDNALSMKKQQLSKVTKPSDILTQEEPTAVKVKKPEIWEKSIGTSGSQRGLAGLIKKRTNVNPSNKMVPSVTSELELGEELTTVSSPVKSTKVTSDVGSKNNHVQQSGNNSGPSGLGLLAGYSGSESDSDPG